MVRLLLLSLLILCSASASGAATLAASQSPGLVGQAGSSDAAEPVDRPDIIVVMVDDLGYIPDDRLLRRLPSINEFWLRDGLRFTQAYNEIPVCCPARANFQSGQHSLRNGVIVNDWAGFDTSVTIATAIDAAGYHTLFVGKYLNGYRGSVVPPGWDRAFITMGSPPRLRDPQFWQDGQLMEYEGMFYDDVVRAKAVRWLRQAPLDEPVFEMVAPYAPHRYRLNCGRAGRLTCKMRPAVMRRDRGAPECASIPDFKPPSYSTTADFKAAVARVPGTWDEGWPLVTSCESLLVVDRMVGQLIEAQADRGRPAYFVFMSDNGMAWGQHGHPLKYVPWATRLPFYVSGPDIDAGRTNARISIIDIPVTLAELAGTSLPAADGDSFLPTLRGEPGDGRPEILEMLPPPPEGWREEYVGWAAIRTGSWRYIRWENGHLELYDLRSDPWELVNVAVDEPAIVMDLEARLDRLIEESAGPT